MKIKGLNELALKVLFLKNELSGMESEVSDLAQKTKKEPEKTDLREFFVKLLKLHSTLDEFEDDIEYMK